MEGNGEILNNILLIFERDDSSHRFLCYIFRLLLDVFFLHKVKHVFIKIVCRIYLCPTALCMFILLYDLFSQGNTMGGPLHWDISFYEVH